MTRKTSLQSLTQRLPPWPQLIRGSVVRYKMTCGRKNCRCHRGFKHGPYWYLSVNRKGKTKMFLIPKQKLAEVRRAVRNYNRWWNTCLRIFEVNTQAALSKEA